MAAVVVVTATAVGVTVLLLRDAAAAAEFNGEYKLEYRIGINGVIVIGIH